MSAGENEAEDLCLNIFLFIGSGQTVEYRGRNTLVSRRR